MTDRTQLAASILTALITKIDNPNKISQEDRQRCVKAAFDWADDFIQVTQPPDARDKDPHMSFVG